VRAALYYFRRDRSLGWRSLFFNAAGVALGVAALITLELFSNRIANTIGRDTKSFLAADYQVQSWRVFTPEVWAAIRKLAPEKDFLRQTDWVSAVQLPSGDAVTVSARALEGDYPFYGKFRTEPALAMEDLRAEPGILLDRSFQARDLKLGDRVRLGEVDFVVKGFILEEPQTVASAFAIGPRIIVHQEWAERTGMIGPTSRAFRMILIRSEISSKEFASRFRERLPDLHWRLITPDRANRQAQRIVDRVSGFLSLVALTAVFLGAAGVFMVFRGRYLLTLPQLLTLRCLGLRSRDLLAVSGLQALTLSILGWGLGSGVGVLLEDWVSRTAQAQLGVALSTPTFGGPLAFALFVTLVVVAVSVVLPLRQVLRTPVSEAFRDSESSRVGFAPSDALALGAAAVLVAALVGRNFALTGIFLGGLVGVVAVLAFGASFFVAALSRIRVASSLALKHALLSLRRQRASTLTLVVVLGLAGFLPSTIFLLSRTFQSQLDLSDREGMPNLFLLGIPPEDRESLTGFVPTMEFSPVTQVRLKSVKGVPIEELAARRALENDRPPEENAENEELGSLRFTREYFSTRRLALSAGERLVAGRALFGAPVEGKVRVSLESGFAENLEVAPGDEVVVEIAGVELPAVVQSTRKVDWYNFRPNFFMVFHEEDLREAPFELVGIGAVPPAKVAELQRDILRKHPTLSVLDGQSLATRLKSLLGQLSTAVFAVGSFAVGSALLVFVGVLLARRSQRLREVALWRCLGLRRSQLGSLLGIELSLTALVAGGLALGFSALMAYVLARFGLDIPPSASGISLAAAVLVVGMPVGLTALGLWLLRSLLNVPTAELFQKEQ